MITKKRKIYSLPFTFGRVSPPPPLAPPDAFSTVGVKLRGSFTFGDGDPNEETVTGVAGTDYGTSSGGMVCLAQYDEATGELNGVAKIKPGDSGGTGNADIISLFYDDDGNCYVFIYGKWEPGSLTLEGFDGTPLIVSDAGTGAEKTMAKLSPDGVWSWAMLLALDVGESTGGQSEIYAWANCYYDGALYVYGFAKNENGKTFQIAGTTGYSFSKTDASVVEFVAKLDVSDGSLIWIRESNVTSGSWTIRLHDYSMDAGAAGHLAAVGLLSNSARVINAGESDEVTTAAADGRGHLIFRDLNGDLLWQYMGGYRFSPKGSVVTPSGILVHGSSGNTAAQTWDDAGGSHVVEGEAKRENLVKYDLAGNFLWARQIAKNWNPRGAITHQGWQPARPSTLYDEAGDHFYIAYNYAGDNTSPGGGTWVFNKGEDDEITVNLGNNNYHNMVAKYDNADGSLLGVYSMQHNTNALQCIYYSRLYLDGDDLIMLCRMDAGTINFGIVGADPPTHTVVYGNQSLVRVAIDAATMTHTSATTIDDRVNSSGTRDFTRSARFPRINS